MKGKTYIYSEQKFNNLLQGELEVSENNIIFSKQNEFESLWLKKVFS